MAQFKLDEYEPVENRIAAFWERFPNGSIQTHLEARTREDGKVEWICRTEMYRDIADVSPASTGYATEIEGSSPVNRTNASENCETSSIGRCAANLGFATKGKRPSRQEMEKVQRAQAPKPLPGDDELWLRNIDALKTLEEARAMYKDAQKQASKKVLDAITLKADTLK